MTIADGWWPPVVTGTMEPTIGGALAMNVHGKNNWCRGTMGEHCLELDLTVPGGGSRTISPDRERDLFHAVIGGPSVSSGSSPGRGSSSKRSTRV